MPDVEKPLHPELRWTLEEVAQHCRRVRRIRCWWRFALLAFGLTAIATGLLALGPGNGAWPQFVGAAYAVAMVAVAVRWLIWPFRKSISLQQVALYIDEHHPELENRIVSVVDFTAGAPKGASDWIIKQFMEDTIPVVRQTSFRDVTQGSKAQVLFLFSAVALVAASVTILEFRGLWMPTLNWAMPEEMSKQVAPLPFTVEPGNARVRKGDNQMVWVRSDEPNKNVSLRFRMDGGVWQEVTAGASKADLVYFHEFADVQEDIEYEVRFGRRVSETYRLTAWLPPEVNQMNLTYHYPEYLEREPKEEPNGGNITAIEGTRVDMDVWVNKQLSKAEMVFDDGERLLLTRAGEGLWTVPVEVSRSTTYKIELVDSDGEPSEYNPKYRITAQQDKPPKIKIDFPKSDQEVTSLDEVPFEFEVADDFGFREFGLQYEIAGREPVRLSLNTDEGLSLSASGFHELMLEEMGLEVGDFITWTVWAKDSKPDRSEWEEVGDPFFLEVRPFDLRFREAVSGAGGGGGGGGAAGELETIQKEILISTWKLRRDIRFHDEESFDEDRDDIVSIQDRILNQVSSGEGVGADAASENDLAALKESMARSIAALRRAEMPDPRGELSEATSAQQMANRLIRRLAPRESEVTQSQSGGGGGGGMSESPDVQELEMARNRNFYEDQKSTQQQQQATDELMKRLKELAQRQQSVNEELAKLISEMQNASEEDKEEIQRKLERLKEELKNNIEQLDEARSDLSNQPSTSRESQEAMEQMDWARKQMNQSLERLEMEDLQRARASATRAQRTLDDVAEQLRQLNRSAASDRMQALQDKMEDLVERQQDIAGETEEANERHKAPSLSGHKENEEAKERIMASKEELEQELVELMEDAADLAERSRQSQELMARSLGDWLRKTAKEGILESIEESKQLTQYDVWDRALNQEESLTETMRRAARGLEEVAENLVEDDLEGMQKALQRLDELMQRPEMQGAAGESREGEQRAEGASGAEGEESQQARGGQGEGEEVGPSESAEGGERTQVASRGEGEESQSAGQESQGESESQGQSQSSEGQQQGGEQQGGQQEGGQQEGGQQQGGEQQGGQQGGQQQGGQQQGGQQQGGQPQSGNRSPGSQNGGSTDGSTGGRNTNTMMQNFVEEDYQDWLRELEEAEELLPQDSPIRPQITQLREQVAAMRRDFRNRSLAPRFELFLDMVARPLAETAEELERQIAIELGEEEFVIADDGAIPERYRQQVADYFRALSDAEGER